MDFTAGYDQLVQDFVQRGIPTDAPGFCDHPCFLEAERGNPEFLRNYAAFIAKRPYDGQYLERARKVVPNAARKLNAALQANGRLGACVDASGILARLLEKEGIWACPIKGSMTVRCPAGTGLVTDYFWSVDHGHFVAGHAWVLAPPFQVVDVTLRGQPYRSGKRQFLQDVVVAEHGTEIEVTLDDIVSESAQAEMTRNGIPSVRQLDIAAPLLRTTLSVFRPLRITAQGGALVDYFPVAIGMPEEPLEGITNMRFEGLTPYELYLQDFQGKLEQ